MLFRMKAAREATLMLEEHENHLKEFDNFRRTCINAAAYNRYVDTYPVLREFYDIAIKKNLRIVLSSCWPLHLLPVSTLIFIKPLTYIRGTSNDSSSENLKNWYSHHLILIKYMCDLSVVTQKSP